MYKGENSQLSEFRYSKELLEFIAYNNEDYI